MLLGGSSRDDRRVNSRYVLKIELTKFAHEWGVRYEKGTIEGDCKVFGLSS